LKVVSAPDLAATKFKVEKTGMERLPKDTPALFLMNHSSFIDLEIAASILYPRPFNIVTTLDAFIGKDWLMRQIGCFPTRKFVTDIGLIKDINYCIKM
jgi:1-acyl-sn-glycerol-3-phosphate acyltransferase